MAEPAIVTALWLSRVQPPPSHPRVADGPTEVYGFVIHHPDGPVLVDTGVGSGHDRLDELYRPDVAPLVRALNDAGVDERDIVAVVNTHLHFDHCGQNAALPHAPLWVQAAEVEASRRPRYTVPEWAEIPPERLRAVDGDADLAPGVRLLAAPGHTPGHQSVLVELGGRRAVIAGQACFTAAEFAAGEGLPGDAHDEQHVALARESLARLRALGPADVYFSHDPTVLRHE